MRWSCMQVCILLNDAVLPPSLFSLLWSHHGPVHGVVQGREEEVHRVGLDGEGLCSCVRVCG